jgi:hypothetical protein
MAVGRAVGMDVHLDFCELAVCEEGKCPFGRSNRVDAGGAEGVG